MSMKSPIKKGVFLIDWLTHKITGHSNLSYIIPIIFLGTSLGSPLLPLTIENHDFVSALSAAGSLNDKELLEKWYILDNKAQPQCYRLKTSDILVEEIISQKKTIFNPQILL